MNSNETSSPSNLTTTVKLLKAHLHWEKCRRLLAGITPSQLDLASFGDEIQTGKFLFCFMQNMMTKASGLIRNLRIALFPLTKFASETVSSATNTPTFLAMVTLGDVIEIEMILLVLVAEGSHSIIVAHNCGYVCLCKLTLRL